MESHLVLAINKDHYSEVILNVSITYPNYS